MKKFNSKTNWIGNESWMYKYTNVIAKNYPEINFTAFKHDNHFEWIIAESNFVVRFILKIMYDLIFLILGIIRNLIKFRPGAIPIMIILYLLLLISTPWYLWKKRNQQIDLTKL